MVHKESGKLIFKEYMYVHFAKRRFILKDKDCAEGFMILPPHQIAALPPELKEDNFEKLVRYRGLYAERLIFLWGRLKKKIQRRFSRRKL